MAVRYLGGSVPSYPRMRSLIATVSDRPHDIRGRCAYHLPILVVCAGLLRACPPLAGTANRSSVGPANVIAYYLDRGPVACR